MGNGISINLPPKIRKGIYVAVVMGTAIMVPLHQFAVIPDVAMAVWTSVAGAASLLAMINVPKSDQ